MIANLKRALGWLCVIAFVAGCGSSSVPRKATAPVCNPPVPARLGQCVHEHFGFTLRPKAISGARGIDISVFQGYPDWAVAKAHGLRFVWAQSSDGYFRQSNFATNWYRQRALQIPHGAYIFLRPGCGSCQGNFLADAIQAVGGQDSNALPPLLDAEVPGAYENVCSAAGALRARLHISVIATYASPGLWDGSPTCGTLLDTAIWGQEGYAFSGWRSRGFIAQQFCGLGCYFPGVGGEVDLQVDHGVLALIHPPCPSCERHARSVELHRLERRVVAIRHGINTERVRIRQIHGTLRVHCGKRRRGRCGTWAREGDEAHRAGDHLHAEGRRVVARVRRLQGEGVT